MSTAIGKKKYIEISLGGGALKKTDVGEYQNAAQGKYRGASF